MSQKNHERLAIRLTDIIVRLNNGERLDLEQLAVDYGVSMRTLRRDFKERLAHLDFEEWGARFYRLNSNKVGYLNLTEIKRFARFASVQDLLPKIDRQFFHDKLNQSVVVKGFTYENIQQHKDDFTAITTAIQQCQIIEFSYRKVTDSAQNTQAKRYRLEPYHLLNKNGIWYVVGRQHEQTRAFCFTRISQLTVTDERFDCDLAVKDSIVETDSLFFDNHISEIVIQVESKVAGYFERRDLLPNQELVRKLDSGDLLLACRNVHPREVIPIVQYWIPHVRIISPAEVQGEMESRLREYLGKFL